ncbi:MAG TPA: YtxH domain-containing protein [Verrucomicrobiae bacterium]|nr:YtxH domain-containing protein [Verrucomicrobiae bacterium]
MLKFIAGLVCGAGVGLLIAPASGEDTRRRLAQAARNPEELAREAVTNIREKAGDMGADLGREAAQKAVDQVMPEKLNPEQRRSG